MSIGAVVIGRNEGARLIACLDAMQGAVAHVIYVDSGSTDGSVAAARARGAQVVELDMDKPFTAARARNAGWTVLPDDVALVQFLDGDCVMQPRWIADAKTFLDNHADVAVVCGRRREMFPEASVYNRLIDEEWDTPVGQTLACGGDALIRRAALKAVGGYREELIAGEEPEMCVRLRAKGWKIWRLDAEMTRHDAQLTRFGQWWQRSKRAGHAFAEGAFLHGAPPERHWVREVRRSLIWGVVLPALIVLTAIVCGWIAMALLALYALQFVRLSVRDGPLRAFFSIMGKFAEGQGALSFWRKQLTGGRKTLIEYK